MLSVALKHTLFYILLLNYYARYTVTFVTHGRHYIGSINRLKSLRIWKESSGGIPNRLEMNATFRGNLKIALCGG